MINNITVFNKVSKCVGLSFFILLNYFNLSATDTSHKVFRKKLNPFTKTVHIADFGAIGNGTFDCTTGFQKAAAYLQEYGGTLVLDPGVYIVGRQKFANNYFAGGSFFNEPILDIRNAKFPIFISGYEATLKCADGLKYGSLILLMLKKIVLEVRVT